VFEIYRDEEIEGLKILDLCAGCGIVGLDFLFHCQNELGTQPSAADFLETQAIYEAHFLKNAVNIRNIPLRFLNSNYNNLLDDKTASKYDLIICNPPYFRNGHGKLSQSSFKNRCRFYLDSDFESLLIAIANSLKPAGAAYVLLKESPEHRWSPFTEAKSFLKSCIVENFDKIRSTNLIRITKL
jgi:tRNA1(Val) A37 N6-methylase TrmN6